MCPAHLLQIMWDFFPDFFPIEGVPLAIASHLLRTYDCDCVAADKEGSKFSDCFAFFDLLCLFENDIDVDVECA